MLTYSDHTEKIAPDAEIVPDAYIDMASVDHQRNNHDLNKKSDATVTKELSIDAWVCKNPQLFQEWHCVYLDSGIPMTTCNDIYIECTSSLCSCYKKNNPKQQCSTILYSNPPTCLTSAAAFDRFQAQNFQGCPCNIK